MENYISLSKTILLLVFFSAYCAIFAWLYLRKGGKRLEEHRDMPLKD